MSITESKKVISSFTDLEAWKEGHKLVLNIYKLTQSFPKTEAFGLVSQMRRAAVSITSNIAEGFSRSSYQEKVRFYTVSQGSLTELQNQLLISRGIGYLSLETFNAVIPQTIRVHKITNGLIKGARAVAQKA
jgi:four helix bundle protein